MNRFRSFKSLVLFFLLTSFESQTLAATNNVAESCYGFWKSVGARVLVNFPTSNQRLVLTHLFNRVPELKKHSSYLSVFNGFRYYPEESQTRGHVVGWSSGYHDGSFLVFDLIYDLPGVIGNAVALKISMINNESSEGINIEALDAYLKRTYGELYPVVKASELTNDRPNEGTRIKYSIANNTEVDNLFRVLFLFDMEIKNLRGSVTNRLYH